MYSSSQRIYSRTNAVHDFADVSDESAVITEPVTKAELKNYARLEGFEDDNESGEFTFDSDDNLLDQLITTARQQLETWTGRSLVPHIWKAWVSNENGDIELPMSNGAILIDAETVDGTAVTGVLVGAEHKFLRAPVQGDLYITYETQGDCPASLKTAIMAEALYRYENRGDMSAEGDICAKALTLAAKYRRVATWLQ